MGQKGYRRPEKSNNGEQGKRFVNPYNFVPLDEACKRDVVPDKPGDLTGYLECGLTVLTPLFIPNTSNSQALHQEWEKSKPDTKSYNFFSYNDLSASGDKSDGYYEPVIPGSEIRGVIRSVFEAAFNGCMSSVDDDRVLRRKKKDDPYHNRIKELLKSNGQYQACSHENNEVCPACAIFGMIPKKEKKGEKGEEGEKGKGNARASRIRFEDARIVYKLDEEKNYYYEPIVLPELGEPRPATVEFYTFSPENKSERGYKQWTYDYVGKDGDAKKVQLRGRKFYWHSDSWKTYVKADHVNEKQGNKEMTSMKQRIRPLKPLSNITQTNLPQFQFRVYYENLTSDELTNLEWSLTFGGDTSCAHKIGRAKPLGFGSVQISIIHNKQRSIDWSTGKWECAERMTVKEPKESSKKGMDALKIMAAWQSKPANVQYPKPKPKLESSQNSSKKTVNDEASHKWFKNNSKGGCFYKVLPKPEQEKNKTDTANYWLYEN